MSMLCLCCCCSRSCCSFIFSSVLSLHYYYLFYSSFIGMGSKGQGIESPYRTISWDFFGCIFGLYHLFEILFCVNVCALKLTFVRICCFVNICFVKVCFVIICFVNRGCLISALMLS